VVQIAPLATLFAFMVGITLGLPAGYYGGKLDTSCHLPRQPDPGLPGDPAVLPAGDTGDRRRGRAATTWRWCCSSSRMIFFGVLLNSRYYTQPSKRTPLYLAWCWWSGWAYACR
jgi:peptide/nickel transport system permease protein